MAWFRRSKHPEEQLSAYIDGELDDRGRRAVEAHVAACDACSALLDDLRTTKSMVAALPVATPRRSFTLGAEYAVPPKPVTRRSAFTFAPAVALTVLVALLFADFTSLPGSTSNEEGDALTAASRQAEMEDAGTRLDTFQAPGAGTAADDGGGPGTAPPQEPRAAQEAPSGTPQAATAPGDVSTMSSATPGADAVEPVATPAGPEDSSGGPSLLRILQVAAGVVFALSLIAVFAPRLMGAKSSGVR
jgi:anti-sigma factor RsiW